MHLPLTGANKTASLCGEISRLLQVRPLESLAPSPSKPPEDLVRGRRSMVRTLGGLVMLGRQVASKASQGSSGMSRSEGQGGGRCSQRDAASLEVPS